MNADNKCSVCLRDWPEGLAEGTCPECFGSRAAGHTTPAPAATIRLTVPEDAEGIDTALVPGLSQTFGDYELLGEIARGGMGVVFKARQKSLNRIVALKMIRGERLAGEEEVRRFHVEASAAAQLHHPNIVAIHEVGEVKGQHFYSMNFVPGQSLSDLAREQTMAPCGRQECAAPRRGIRGDPRRRSRIAREQDGAGRDHARRAARFSRLHAAARTANCAR